MVNTLPRNLRHSGLELIVNQSASTATYVTSPKSKPKRPRFHLGMMRSIVLVTATVALALNCVDAFAPLSLLRGNRPPSHDILSRMSSTVSTLSAVSSNWDTDTAVPAAPVESVRVLADASAVSAAVSEIVRQAARRAIAERGHFALAIPGGSILKMLVDCVDSNSDNGDSWTSQTTLVYVNHKCVAMEDEQLSTHAKATKLFLNQWKGCNVITMDGTDNGPAEAYSYQAKLRALSSDILPISSSSGYPVFDLALIGVGDDGHIGSLYPQRDEVAVTDDWVVCVAMKQPPSISLTLPVMTSAQQVVVAACGVSDKYPAGKSDGMRRAIADPGESPRSFPASGLRSVATWVLDEAAASKLGPSYLS
jgi:6-phosphogluconolactonase